ncbi:MAG: exopolysaccharide biosynthesis polyprenyl glycosylphosphotransferase [Clostridia bacterium]|nr:exopolysaccharide biosynthesis polyprenyl glycosylphosphotransferase [Clostridia bacterium]
MNERKGLFATIESYIDIFLNIIAMLVAYFFAFIVKGDTVIIDGVNTVSLFDLSAAVGIVLIALLSSFAYHAAGLYVEMRYMRRYPLVKITIRANLVFYGIVALIVLLIASDYYEPFFLFWTLFAAVFSTALIIFKCRIIRGILKSFRSRSYTVKRVIIVGDNADSAKEYIKQSGDYSRFGIDVIGFVGERMGDDLGAPCLGSFSSLAEVLDQHKPSDVVFAIDSYDKRRLIKLVNMCDDRCIKVYFLPATYGFFKSPNQIERVGTLPIVNVHRTPLDNPVNAAMKRAVDIVGSILLIILTSPIMLVTAIGVKLSSPGPILFRQIRAGKMGRNFMMYKFRSMRVNSLSNKAWTTNVDLRKTRFGNFIRKSAIDELPQLFNVLRGDMSLVGPRPEIPVFVEQFKEIIPLYMVKHYVKPGMTGLAQVKGLRGDTSVEERIHEDIEYIENWSLLKDIFIIFKTPFVMFNKNEKYYEEAPDGELLDDESTRDIRSK